MLRAVRRRAEPHLAEAPVAQRRRGLFPRDRPRLRLQASVAAVRLLARNVVEPLAVDAEHTTLLEAALVHLDDGVLLVPRRRHVGEDEIGVARLQRGGRSEDASRAVGRASVARSAARRARLLLVELARPLRRAVPQLRRVGEASAGDHEAAAAIVELERAEARRHVEVAPLRGVRNVHWAACGRPAVGAEAKVCGVRVCACACVRACMRACSSSRSEKT